MIQTIAKDREVHLHFYFASTLGVTDTKKKHSC